MATTQNKNNRSRNSKVLANFVRYCEANPELRFWQALRSWTKYNFIYVSNNLLNNPELEIEDTFYWENKDS